MILYVLAIWDLLGEYHYLYRFTDKLNLQKGVFSMYNWNRFQCFL